MKIGILPSQKLNSHKYSFMNIDKELKQISTNKICVDDDDPGLEDDDIESPPMSDDEPKWLDKIPSDSQEIDSIFAPEDMDNIMEEAKRSMKKKKNKLSKRFNQNQDYIEKFLKLNPKGVTKMAEKEPLRKVK